MTSLILDNTVVAFGEIEEDNEKFIVNKNSFYFKTIFGNATIVNEDPPKNGNWNYIDGKFIEIYSSKNTELTKEAEEVRGVRNQLLFNSDWTQLADAPVNRAAWATYRQALRDISKQAGFPLGINWPEKP